MNFIQDSFKRFSQYVRSTSHWVLLEVHILYHTKDAYFWICVQNFSWRIRHLKIQGKLWKIIAACNVSNNAPFPQVFFCHILTTEPKDFWSFSNFFHSISASHSLETIQIQGCFLIEKPNERCRISTQWLW